MIVDQIVDLASVDFVHGYGHGEVPFMFLEVIDSSVEQIFDG